MSLAQSASKTSRRVFGVTLSEEMAAELRDHAEHLSMPPTTLAARLLEAALKERRSFTDSPKNSAPRDDADLLVAVNTLLQHVNAIRRDQTNLAIKLLSLGGLSPEQISEWVRRRLSD